MYLMTELLISFSIKKRKPIVTELFIRGRKLNISLVFIRQSYLAGSKDVGIDFTHYFIMKIPNKKQIQHKKISHLLDIDFKDFINLYKESAAKPYSFLVNITTFVSDNPLRFRYNLRERSSI